MQPPSCSGTGVSLPLMLAMRSALKLRMRSAMVSDRVKAVRPLDRSEAAVLDAEIRQLASNRTCERVASDAGRVLLHH
jgi:hypothetical protein